MPTILKKKGEREATSRFINYVSHPKKNLQYFLHHQSLRMTPIFNACVEGKSDSTTLTRLWITLTMDMKINGPLVQHLMWFCLNSKVPILTIKVPQSTQRVNSSQIG